MPNLTSVTVTAGVPTAGSGTVSTIDALMADGGQVTLGAKADAKSSATDATAITVMQVLKQVSAELQLLRTALGSTALDLGSGTSGSRTLRTMLDTSQLSSPISATFAYAAGNIAAVALPSDQVWGVGSTGFTKLEDAPSADGDKGVPAMAIQQSTPADTAGTNADYAMLQMSGGRLWASSQVYGDTAAAASDAGNPVKIGGVGKTANPTAVTDGQRVNAIFDKLGKQIVVGAIRDLKGVTQTSVSNTTSETTIVAAVASTFCDLYGLILANTGATTTKVTIKDATSGTVRAIIEVPTLETRGFILPVDSAIPQATVNNNWTATCASATTAMEVTAMWVKNT